MRAEYKLAPVDAKAVESERDADEHEKNVKTNETAINKTIDVLMESLDVGVQQWKEVSDQKSTCKSNCTSIKVKWTDIASLDTKWMKTTAKSIDNNLALEALTADVTQATVASTLSESEKDEFVIISNGQNITNSSSDSNQYSSEFIDESKPNKVVIRTSFSTSIQDAASNANITSSVSTFYASSETQAIDKNADLSQHLMTKTTNDTLAFEHSVHILRQQTEGERGLTQTTQYVNNGIKAETLKFDSSENARKPVFRSLALPPLRPQEAANDSEINVDIEKQTVINESNSMEEKQPKANNLLFSTNESNLTSSKHRVQLGDDGFASTTRATIRSPASQLNKQTFAISLSIFGKKRNDTKVAIAKTNNQHFKKTDRQAKISADINAFDERTQRESFNAKDDERDAILPRRQCFQEHLVDVNWNLTDAGVLALSSCPLPYIGSVYRPCYSSGSWGKADYTECRLPHLREIQNLILYHVHKHLVDGLYPLAEELSRLVTSTMFPIKSPMDRLDAFDALNAILRAKIKIRMENEVKDATLIRSLVSTADQLLTSSKVSFAVEAEKNALITMKSAETIFGLRLLSENILRALIVFCNDGTIKRITSINPNTKNIKIFLKHRTPFGILMPLLLTNSSEEGKAETFLRPQANVHFEDFQKLGVGMTMVWIRGLGTELNNQYYDLVSDVVLVSVVPPVSIEVDFAETPKVEIDFKLNKFVSNEKMIKCGRIKTPRELWTKNDCRVVRRNLTDISCLCSEMGAIAVLHQKSLESAFERSRSSCHLNRFVIYTSAALSLLLLIAAMVGQLLGIPPFKANVSHHNYSPRQTCKYVALLLHYIHLVSGFWMLSHSIYLYQRLWRPASCYSLSPLSFAESDSLTYRASCCSCFCSKLCSQWSSKHFALVSWIVPALIVASSYFLNPVGYEYRRYCWMSIEGGMMYSFIVPVSLLIMTNTVVMLLVLKRFFANKPIIHKIEIERTQPSLRSGVTLLPFFAVNWFLSVLALEDKATTLFQYIFAIVIYHLKSRILKSQKREAKSTLKLKKSHSCRTFRTDVPRLYLGDESRPSGAILASSEQERLTYTSDSQPLLMPYSTPTPTFDPSLPSTSKQ
ncbi:hypothetical protein B4U79_13257 [Dinothrombium tinctorium]|uniref:G-protein coupled receptors family 2 profile 2 domain-containing protein n=1 Tax=Dinothrombium tinctorium TaxID=1965070 RepID=A0A3S3S4F1_9ACAR|nr:hypothetical protein B4U79_04559 [Dinothrombium tinctorium]RWS15556.1 hypothetical protein B4U79_13257 [Dinothrombium tinctorium]